MKFLSSPTTKHSLIKISGHPNFPLALLLIVNIIVGSLTFRDYGLSWDEPLFYKYADALGYAYSIPARLSGDFNIERAYGPSGTDHKTRGPAYLLVAREPVYLLKNAAGIDDASAWHLVNFLTFQVGVYFLYRLCLRWMKPWSAFAGTLLFSTQPLLWGHAFINPKDPSFMVFFMAAIYLGFQMSDELTACFPKIQQETVTKIIIAGIILGLTTSIRVLGPLAGIFVFLYFLSLRKPKAILWFIPYAMIAALTACLTWPYLWDSPISRFIEAFRIMSENPTQLPVLFDGLIHQADELPRRYLPVLLGITLTEPTWPLFAIGLAAGFIRAWKKHLEWRSLGITLAWFTIPFLYVLVKKPPMYDGYRHFLFILPPVFIAAGLAFEAGFSWLRANWSRAVLITLLIFPGIYGSIRLHPYEYTYYNTFIGGTGGAFRRFETDYWLTCYKESMEKFNRYALENPKLYVHREAYIAEYYAASGITVKEYRGEFNNIQRGDYVLVSSRSNEDKKIFRDSPILLSVGRDGATYCVIKHVQ